MQFIQFNIKFLQLWLYSPQNQFISRIMTYLVIIEQYYSLSPPYLIQKTIEQIRAFKLKIK